MAPQPKDKAATLPKHPCIRCKNNVGKEYAVKCGVCEQWVHKDCEGIPEEVFKFISANVQRGVLWQCTSCQASTAKLDAAVKSLRSDLTSVTSRVEKMEENSKLVDSRLGQVEGQVGNLQNEVSKVREEVAASIFEEMRLREERKNNILLHNVQEPPRSTWEEEKSGDVALFNSIMSEMQLDIKFEKDTFFSRRLGARTDSRARPLLVGLRTEATKLVILESAKKLASTKFSAVAVVPDLTKQQREADDGLREEANRRNANLSQQDKAKNLKWVVVGRKGTRKLIKKQADQTHSHQQTSNPGSSSSSNNNNSRKRGRTTAVPPRIQRPRVASGTQAGTSGTHGEEADMDMQGEDTSTDPADSDSGEI